MEEERTPEEGGGLAVRRSARSATGARAAAMKLEWTAPRKLVRNWQIVTQRQCHPATDSGLRHQAARICNARMSNGDETMTVETTAEAETILDAAEALRLGLGISKVEGAKIISKAVLENLGLGAAFGQRLSGLKSEKKRAEKIIVYVAELLSHDTTLWDVYGDSTGTADEHRRTTHLELARLVSTIVDHLMAVANVSATIVPKAPENNTSYVVTQSEEERAFSLTTYTIEEATKQRGVLVKLHNLRVRPFLTPSIGALKNLGYWLKVEMCWPDPHRLKLEKFKRDPNDTPFLKFKRMVYGVAIILAGEKVPVE